MFEWYPKGKKLHSGSMDNFFINCDSLTDKDWEALAAYAVTLLPCLFGWVVGIPQGGIKFAQALEKYAKPEIQVTLIVDDVLTTGESMEAERWKHLNCSVLGVVVFARGVCPAWVTPLFEVNRRLWTASPRKKRRE